MVSGKPFETCMLHPGSTSSLGAQPGEFSCTSRSAHSLICSDASVGFFGTLRGSLLPLDALDTSASCSGPLDLSQAPAGKSSSTCCCTHLCMHSDTFCSCLGHVIGLLSPSDITVDAVLALAHPALQLANVFHSPLSLMLEGTSSHCSHPGGLSGGFCGSGGSLGTSSSSIEGH